MTVIRSKFRVVQLSDLGTGTSTARLIPVMPRSKWEPNGSEENAAFWTATPSGEIEVPAEWLPPASRQVGSSAFVDVFPGVAPEEAGQLLWSIGECVLSAYSFRLKLHPEGRSGRVELGIDNPVAILMLLPSVMAAIAAPREWRQAHGSDKPAPPYPWRVEFVAVT